jgi:hypothetical protein
MSARLSGNRVSLLCPRSSVRSCFKRPICSETSDSPFSASTKLSSSVCSHTESGTRPSCFFQKLNSDEESGMNQIIARSASMSCPRLSLAYLAQTLRAGDGQPGNSSRSDSRHYFRLADQPSGTPQAPFAQRAHPWKLSCGSEGPGQPAPTGLPRRVISNEVHLTTK